MSKEFFAAVRERPAPTAITSLLATDGSIARDPERIEKVCAEFYAKLY